MGSPAIFKGTETQLLTTGGLKLANGQNKDVLVGTDNPTLVATSADAGAIYLRSGTNEVYVKQADGNNTKWQLLKLSDAFKDLSADFTGTDQFVTGNNATFDNGGTFNGTFTKSTTASELINGNNVFKWVGDALASNNDNNFIASEVIDIPQGLRGRNLTFTSNYRWDGGSTNIAFRVKDTTNGVILNESSPDYLDTYTDSTNNTAGLFAVTMFVPSDAAQLEIGFQIITGEANTVFLWDNLRIEDEPFVLHNIQEQTIYSARVNSDDAVISQSEDWLDDVNNSSTGVYDVTFDTGFFSVAPAIVATVAPDSAVSQRNINVTNISTSGCQVRIADGSSSLVNQDFNIYAQRQGDDYNRFRDYVVTPAKFEEPETKLLAADVTSNGVMSDLTFTGLTIGQLYRFNIHARIITDNGDVVNIEIENGATQVGLVQAGESGNATNFGASDSGVFEATSDTLTFTAGSISGVSAIKGSSDRRDTYVQLERYETSFLATFPTNNYVVLKDVKSNGTSGGTFTSGSYQTRDLNTVEGVTSIVSLSSNQFTLQAGTYNTKIIAPFFRCSTAKARLQNITDGTTVALSDPSQNNTSSGDPLNNFILTTFTINAAKTFEVQHRCNTTRATNGFGLAASFGDDEVYTQVLIEKVV